MMWFWLYLFGLVSTIFCIDALQRLVYKNLAWSRKATHVLTGLAISAMPLVLSLGQILLLSGIFTLMMGVSKMKRLLSLHQTNRQTWGELLFPLGVGLTALICLPGHPKAYYAAMLSLSLADTAANLLGSRLPMCKIHWRQHTKSVGGFLACTITIATLLSIIYPPHNYSMLYIVLAAPALGLVETLSIYGSDNVTLPLSTALICLVGQAHGLL